MKKENDDIMVGQMDEWMEGWLDRLKDEKIR